MENYQGTSKFFSYFRHCFVLSEDSLSDHPNLLFDEVRCFRLILNRNSVPSLVPISTNKGNNFGKLT